MEGAKPTALFYNERLHISTKHHHSLLGVPYVKVEFASSPSLAAQRSPGIGRNLGFVVRMSAQSPLRTEAGETNLLVYAQAKEPHDNCERCASGCLLQIQFDVQPRLGRLTRPVDWEDLVMTS